jgi:hypothetical protein
MTRTISLVLVALLPSLASAQAGALQQAKGAQQTTDQGNARVMQAADAAQEATPAAGNATAAGAGQLALPPSGAKVEGAARSADQGMGTVPPPDTYTVRPGDTLWDLSGRFLNNPWYWPKVWSFNPDITNPHWIEPGNVLRFYPSAEEAPTRVEPVVAGPAGVPTPAPTPAAEPGDAEPPPEAPDLMRIDMKAPAPVEVQEEVAVVGPYRIGAVPPKNLYVRRDSFVTPQQLEESGTLFGAFEERLMLTTTDRVYARFNRDPPSKVGESYLVFRTEREIYHPITNELVGYQTRILGSATVIAKGEDVVTLELGQVLDPVERGAMLGPWVQKTFVPVKPTAAKVDLDGHILASRLEMMTQVAESQIVFIDKGKTDGVEEGNIFRVVRGNDPSTYPNLHDPRAPPNDPAFPLELMGELLVIDVKEVTSTAIVLKSIREMAVGDTIQLRVHPNGPP